MSEFRKTMDVYQGLNFKKDKQTTVGYITSLKIGEAVLLPDLSYIAPIDPDKTRQAVAVLSNFLWEAGAADAFFFSGQLSVANKQALSSILMSNPEDMAVEVVFSIYDYDPVAKKYFTSAHSRNIALRGTVEKQAKELNLTVADDPSAEVQEPINYAFNIGIKPVSFTQQIHIATTNNKELTKGWGTVA